MKTKDPDDVLDYVFDFTQSHDGGDGWLGNDTIESYEVIVPAGLTKDSDSESGGKVTVWLSGGTAGIDYVVTCRIVTALGRTKDQEETWMIRGVANPS